MRSGPCAARCEEPDVLYSCELCAATVCDACVQVCPHHGCGKVVCSACFGDYTCAPCADYVCESCDAWADCGLALCACCVRKGCSRCIEVISCEACGGPTCTECGSMLPDTAEWMCHDCRDNEVKVYTENLDLNPFNYSALYPLLT